MKLEDVNGYEEALEYAGAKVHCFEEFGSYQGDWWAKVTYEGKTFWVHDYYGSCSGCDAFGSEFGYSSEITHERMMRFALDYLDSPLTQDEAEKTASKDIAWDLDAEEVLAFIKDNAIEKDRAHD